MAFGPVIVPGWYLNLNTKVLTNIVVQPVVDAVLCDDINANIGFNRKKFLEINQYHLSLNWNHG
jgi:hypothetical protein